MGENCVNEVAINMDVSIGEELDYEANDNIEHEEDSSDKIETNQHERIIKEVSTSDSESVNATAVKERTNNADLIENNNSRDSKSSKDSKPKTNEEGCLVKVQRKDEKDKDSKEKQQTSTGRAACKPCNLLFENKKWMEKHNDSGDHTHVIKGFNPGGGKYYCYLCWLGFEHSEMLLHHIKRSEHITRARRRGVCDLYLKPLPKSSEKSSSKLTKLGEGIHHKTGSHKDSTHSHANILARKPSSHKSSSSSSHRSRSPLRIRLSDYYEVSSVGQCDTSGIKLRSLNGVHKSRGEAKKYESKKDQNSPKAVDKEEKNHSKNENLSLVTNIQNGFADQEEKSESRGEAKDLNPELCAEPPDICLNKETNVVENISERKDPSENEAEKCPKEAVEICMDT